MVYCLIAILQNTNHVKGLEGGGLEAEGGGCKKREGGWKEGQETDHTALCGTWPGECEPQIKEITGVVMSPSPGRSSQGSGPH